VGVLLEKGTRKSPYYRAAVGLSPWQCWPFAYVIRFYIKYTNNFLKKQKRFGPNQEKPVYKLGAARILN
jgi:hypothetical protein